MKSLTVAGAVLAPVYVSLIILMLLLTGVKELFKLILSAVEWLLTWIGERMLEVMELMDL